MARADLISGVILLILGIALAVFIIPDQIENSTDATISPRLMPQICAYAIIILSFLLIFNTLRRGLAANIDEVRFPISGPEFGAAIMVIAVFLVCIVLFIYSGPLIPAIILIAVPMLLMGERNPAILVLVPGGLIATAYFLIYQVLGTSLQ